MKYLFSIAMGLFSINTHAGLLADARREGLDKVEARLLKRLPNVERRGSTLSLSTSSGPIKFVDNETNGEAYVKHNLIGSFDVEPRRKDYCILVSGYEGWSFVLINGKTGRQTRLTGEPVLSPDKKHFAAASMDLDAGYLPNGLEVIRASDFTSVFRHEWGELDRSGPSNPKWKSGGRLLFELQTFVRPGQTTSTPMEVQEIDGKWVGPSESK